MEETSIFEYELIDIAVETNYDFPEEEHSVVKENGSQDVSAIEGKVIEYDADGIPMGSSMQEIRERESIIAVFLSKWRETNTDGRILNTALEDYIYFRNVSFSEAKEHSSKSYMSTRAVMILDEVLKSALPVRRVAVKANDQNQGSFAYMLVMVYRHQEIGTIKLTVGVRLSGQRVQYGITALQPGEKLIKDAPRKNKKRNSHR